MPKKYAISKIPHTICHTIVNKFNDFMGYQNQGIKLHEAIQNEDYNLINQILADKHTNPNLRDVENKTPLYYAFQKGKEDIMESLLNHHNIDVNSPLSLGLSPLQTAALFGRDKYLKLLLEKQQLQVNVVDEIGDNVLAYAIYSGNIEAVRLLVDCPDFNIRHQNMFGCNVLHLASMNRQLEVVKLLLKKMDAYEQLEAINYSKQHFQHILVRVFGEDNALTAQQLADLKEIFQYRVLLNKKEIDNISNQELQNLVHDIDENIYQCQYGKMKSAHLSMINQVSLALFPHNEEMKLTEYASSSSDDMILSDMNEEL